MISIIFSESEKPDHDNERLGGAGKIACGFFLNILVATTIQIK